MFPQERQGLDEYVRVTNDAMISVRYFCASKLFPYWLQRLYWKVVPKRGHPSTETIQGLLDRCIQNKELKSYLASLWIDSGGDHFPSAVN
jgi:hypothetical protein